MISGVESESGILLVVLLAAATIAGVSASRRLGVPAPLALVVVGVVASYLPFIPPVELEPGLVLTVILPPLLYIAAVQTSFRAVAANPVTMAGWGLIVAAALVLGSLPVFLGLAVVMPVLGHATWRLYRKVVV